MYSVKALSYCARNAPILLNTALSCEISDKSKSAAFVPVASFLVEHNPFSDSSCSEEPDLISFERFVTFSRKLNSAQRSELLSTVETLK